MNPWLTVFTTVIVILIIWLALLRNAMNYKPDFELDGHGEEGQTHEGESH